MVGMSTQKRRRTWVEIRMEIRVRMRVQTKDGTKGEGFAICSVF